MTSLFLPRALPPVDEKEALRYAGVKDPSPEILDLFRSLLPRAAAAVEPKLCYAEVPVTPGDRLDLGFAKTDSRDLRRCLAGCRRAVVFCATAGLGTDLLIAKNRLSPSRQLIFQAIGAERVEALCDLFCDRLKEKVLVTPRFSPGYGDLPLSFQTEIFSLLNPPKYLGVSLGESYLMTPSKSVTALVGIRETLS